LHLTVRRFYCHHPFCLRRTFAERLPHLLDRHAQRTRRLAKAQARTGLALGGAPAARLLVHLAMPASARTLLRAVHDLPLPTRHRPNIVGVDDWALRKGRTYATLLVDLERRRPIDLLPDRSAPMLGAWLRRHPQIQLVARDRSTEYARGITMGAPGAVQVADRWHLLFNARQMLERWLARAHPRLKQLPSSPPLAPSTQRSQAYPRTPSEALARTEARGRWEAFYEDVQHRRAAGQSLRRIHRETGLARATVRKYAFSNTFPCHGLRGPAPSILDPYLDYLHARLEAGCENAMQLWREARDRGFAGTPKQVRRWLSERRSRPAKTTTRQWRALAAKPETALLALPSPQRLSWLLLREAEELSSEEAALVARVRQDDEAATVVDLARRLCQIVRRAGLRERQDDLSLKAFETWLAEARNCHVRVVKSFATSLDQDGAAVRAALTLPWSNGQAEGQINRLKLLKQAMYGRASLGLLRRRLILAP